MSVPALALDGVSCTFAARDGAAGFTAVRQGIRLSAWNM